MRLSEACSESVRVGSSVGTRALLARSLHVARAEFPFLQAIRAGSDSDAFLLTLNARMDDVDPREAGDGLKAILGIPLDLLVGFIGEDLTLSLVRQVWPDLPGSELPLTSRVR